jgi:diguanylate cyclase (GGDEF)-like protein
VTAGQASDVSQARGNAQDPPHLEEYRTSAPNQLGLDDLVTRVAVELMSVTADSVNTTFASVLGVLNEFFDVDTSFLRRNDPEREMSILVAEWPQRQNVPDPDPLGEVPFGQDPTFDATRDLTQPYLMRPTNSSEEYRERVREGSGIAEVSLAMVPLTREHATVGVLGFVSFGDRIWEVPETNALQTVASLMVQVQARVEAEQRLTYQADHDELTGLPNRRSLLTELRRRLQRNATEPVGLGVLGLDGFKALNDFLGRGAGDLMLATVADRLRHAMRAEDFIARLSGDEFVVLLGRPAVQLNALDDANRLLDFIRTPVGIRGHQVSRTASLGIAFGSGESATAEILLEQADAALQLAKARGRNQAAVFDSELRSAVEQRSEAELQLRDAIEYGGLVLHYQPEVDLRTGRLLAVEALVRWNHPVRGLLTAGEFIKVAEETGLIADLGRWVLSEACHQMSEWQAQYPSLSIQMRVNVSPAQLTTRNIVALVAQCLSDNGLAGALLCLEITEHAVVSDVEQTVEVLHELKALGVSLAIDDFGTGYSSMSQLKRLPVDALKIDQTFVAGLGIDAGDHAIVDATVRLAASFGLDLIGEGGETTQMAHELLRLGCYRAQGFLLCRPKSAVDLIPVLQEGRLDLAFFTRRDDPADGSRRLRWPAIRLQRPGHRPL